MMQKINVWLLLVGTGALVQQPTAPLRRRVAHLRAAMDVMPAILGTTSAVALGVGVLSTTQAQPAIDDKSEVEKYFNGDVGFGRWNKIYSESDEVNKVQKDIRDGHAETIAKVLSWVDDANGKTWCDLGCGVGSLAIPVAQKGASVYASDISAAMVSETSTRADSAGVTLADCQTLDMEAVTGSYDAVSCIDVMIHYPTDTMVGLVDKLTSLSKDRVFVSFAPNTPAYTLLKAIGGLFPGPSKTTRAYLHKEADVEKALNDKGFVVKRRHLTATNFYFSLLFEAVPAASAA